MGFKLTLLLEHNGAASSACTYRNTAAPAAARDERPVRGTPAQQQDLCAGERQQASSRRRAEDQNQHHTKPFPCHVLNGQLSLSEAEPVEMTAGEECPLWELFISQLPRHAARRSALWPLCQGRCCRCGSRTLGHPGQRPCAAVFHQQSTLQTPWLCARPAFPTAEPGVPAQLGAWGHLGADFCPLSKPRSPPLHKP